MKSKCIKDTYNGKCWVPHNSSLQSSVEYIRFDQLHNENGPAYEGGLVIHWVINGARHRINGPATIAHSIISAHPTAWYLHGTCWYEPST